LGTIEHICDYFDGVACFIGKKNPIRKDLAKIICINYCPQKKKNESKRIQFLKGQGDLFFRLMLCPFSLCPRIEALYYFRERKKKDKHLRKNSSVE